MVHQPALQVGHSRHVTKRTMLAVTLFPVITTFYINCQTQILAVKHVYKMLQLDVNVYYQNVTLITYKAIKQFFITKKNTNISGLPSIHTIATCTCAITQPSVWNCFSMNSLRRFPLTDFTDALISYFLAIDK